MTAFLSILQAVAAVLSASPALAGGFVQVGREMPLPAHVNQGLFILPVSAPGEAPFASRTAAEWDFALTVRCVCRTGLADLDALLAAAYARLAAAPAPEAADGWVVRPRIGWEIDEADTTLVLADLVLTVSVRTADGSLEAG